MTDPRTRIEEILANDRIVLFMKGTKSFPQCGFSSTVVQILDQLDCEFSTFNVLADDEIRQGIKEYANWPTIPQLYVGGEFVGGCDIVREMFASGELSATLGASMKVVSPPTITVTPEARKQLETALDQADTGDRVHLTVSAAFEHSMHVGPQEPGELEVDLGGFILLVDRSSAPRAQGLTIDFQDGPEGTGFAMDNPNRPA